MSNSSLVTYTKISPNQSGKRGHAIDTITIHCVVGQCAIEALGMLFAVPSKQASSNYGIGYDGKIGMFVEEDCHSWCSSDFANDDRAITIECASDAKQPYAVNDRVYAALLNLVTDICKRNGIKKLVWSTNKEDRVNHRNGCNMTVHRDYANKSCPGTYLYERMGKIASAVNERLGSANPTPAPTPTPVGIKKGDAVKIKNGATYTNGRTIPNLILAETWIVEDVKGNIVRINKSIKNGWAINSTVDQKYLTVVGKTFEPYIIRVEVDALNIRLAPSTLATVVGTIRDRGAYTIVAEEDGLGATRWGKLKSGAGWVSLDYCKFVRKA